ncbi:AAA family ATPase [Spiroplasma platyhelix]|uniref:ATP-binding protein n=1 Tax=Spiroplasma platyhelix PALS-1 TaxID=1276218 RepID=A0A846U116_9MOLU|nr:AAA family ATPase [Spiroplasma platyhelix]MBE4703826.1 hypothetical protein [Spiroplasma platyhelix PALS-1]NKE38199.1 ATP-binding protein [Spiroplasma platyhelix PALS-1]UJB29084.1 hypothetical protein SPLAT_v1c03200 [Spiroplasma platyhelix PALS-1]
MKIELTNIGPFKKSEIKLEDLTLIAGINDTGKSFLNKVIYSIIKIINADKISLALRPLTEILVNWDSRYEYYFYRMHKTIKRDDKENKFFLDINKKFEELKNILIQKEKNNYDETIKKIKELNNEIENILKTLNNTFNKEGIKINNPTLLIKDRRQRLIENIQEISQLMSSTINLIKKNNLEFINQAILNVNFKNETIKNKYFLNDKSKIFIKDKNKNIEIEIDDENISKITNETIFRETIRDITYINNLTNLIDNKFYHRFHDDNLYSFSDFNFNIDANFKIRKSNDSISSDKFTIAKFSELITQIKKEFNTNSQINYSKGTVEKDGIEFKIVNMSQGLVNLENFKLLIYSGIFDENKIVIFDEPENSFHPKWQHLYIKMIFELIKLTKCKIILATHSPYIIESVYSYIKYNQELFDLKVNFNLLDLKSNGNSVIKTYKSPERILKLLIEPYDELDRLKYKWSTNKNTNSLLKNES